MMTHCRGLLTGILLVLILSPEISSANDSSHLRISVLTCSPGEELYSTWGHSALRIIDSLNNDDIVYNYGTFNFEEPGFYTKFIRGKLEYYLSTSDYKEFKSFYAEEGRGITEQVINLSTEEKLKTNLLLHQNLQSENRFYKYDFLFDNCTTRLRDLIENSSANKIVYGTVLQHPATFRNLIHEYLDRNNKLWGKLGIDLLLGSKTDAIMKPREIMFLPDYLMYSFDKAKVSQASLINQTLSVLPSNLERISTQNTPGPLVVFSILFVLLSLPSFFSTQKFQLYAHLIDRSVFFITGLVGLIIVFMWTGTDHVMCSNNYNLLWALPTHIYGAFYVNTHKPKHQLYFKIITIWFILLLASWLFLPQQMNAGFLPVIIFMLYRSFKIGFRKPVLNY